MKKYLFISICLLIFVFGCKENEGNNSIDPIKSIDSIKENFKRINAISPWDSIQTVDLFESTEGGILKKFYANNTLEKMVEIHFGESGKLMNEYYLMNNKLSFFFSEDHQYNRPIYFDEKMMKEYNDTTFFDSSKSVIKESRSYFYEDKRIFHIPENPTEVPSENDILNEFNRLKDKK